jgi:2-polyprenyl-6-methoxyphenol hydroxylase-like FAD-dependent oxidoreductase
VAGQGLNVGIFDAACLARLVKEWSFLGLDWGSPLMLSSYERERRKDAWALIASTHGVVRLFSTASPLVRKLRQMGMNLIQHLPFAREAMIHRASRL